MQRSLTSMVSALALIAGLGFAQAAQAETTIMTTVDFWDDVTVETTTAALATGIDINAIDDNGYSALIRAGNEGASAEVVQFLLDNGADVNQIGHDGRPPFFWVSKGGDLAALDVLLSANPDLDVLDDTKRNAYAHATRAQTDPAVYARLVEIGIDPMLLDENGRSALHEAAQRTPSVELLAFLHEQGLAYDTLDNDGMNVVLNAAYRNPYLDVVQFLAEHADVTLTDANGNNAVLLAAVRNPSVEVLDFLLAQGLSAEGVNAEGRNAIALAAENDAAVMQRLIDLGLDVNLADANGETPLVIAAAENEPGIVGVLLMSGKVDIEMSGAAALHEALSHGDENGQTNALLLLEAGVDAATLKDNGDTALTVAANADQPVDLLRALIESGADVNAVDSNGMTALLHYAATSGNADAIRFLVEAGADTTAADSFGDTVADMVSDNAKLAGSDVIGLF
ncbi:ankyrin repeat domain-containing protein [Pacificibacter sp. AS14]|uniref:ankyrin repeat domain-containing protein n=1 Tax=Pacificibacter sp. AS14 TaxID=3135785 RepID=UPI003175C1DD